MPDDTTRYAMNTPDGGTAAPVITDPTGGAPNFNIEEIFKSFGYTPTQAEISALAPAFEGRINVGQTGTSAVANYVQAHQALGDAESLIKGNLLDEQTAAKNAQTLGQVLETQGQEAYDAAANIYAQAPRLFGSLTADQIGDFLAPAKQAFEQAQGSAEGAASSRGLAGSSIEGNAIGQNLTQFMQSVLSQGLGIGLQQQQNQAGVLQNKGNQLFAAGQQQYGLGPQYLGLANSSAANNATLAGSISGLPGAAVNQALAQQAAIRALSPQKQTFGGQILSGLESAGVQDVVNLGQNVVSSVLPGVNPGANPFQIGKSLLGSGNTPTGAAVGATPVGAMQGVDFTGGLAGLA